MKKILMLILFVSYVNAELVITKEVITDSVVNAMNRSFKELTGQNDKKNEENCKNNYENLYARHSKELIKQKNDNVKLKDIALSNNIEYKSKKIKHLPIRKDKSYCILYWDYLKSSSHDISELQKENNKLKILLSKKNINYAPLLKVNRNNTHMQDNEQEERKKAKKDLKKQMQNSNVEITMEQAIRDVN